MTRTVRLFYHHRVFKGKRKATGKERSQNKDLKSHVEMELGTFSTKRRVLTDFASLGLSLLYSKIKLYG